jgi:hypothetical protein
VISKEAEIEAERFVTINGSTIYLVNANDDDDGQTDAFWSPLNTAQVGQKVRILVNTTESTLHYDAPYVGVVGCWFYDRHPSSPNAVQFDLVDQYGCNKPPAYYDPFTDAATPMVNGMLLNKKPIDAPQGNASSNPVTTVGGYMTGECLGQADHDKK